MARYIAIVLVMFAAALAGRDNVVLSFALAVAVGFVAIALAGVTLGPVVVP